MDKDTNAFKAGLFILLSMAAAVAVLIAIRGAGQLFEPERDIDVAFDLTQNLGGLKVGDPLRVGGFDQGRVSDIQFEPPRDQTPAHFVVRCSIPKKYDLRCDAAVQIEQALTGSADLNITGFGTGTPWHEGTPLHGQASAFSTLTAIGPAAQGLIADIRAKINPGYARYEKVTNQASALMSQGSTSLKGVADIIDQNKASLHDTLDNLRTTSATLKDRLPGAIDRATALLDSAKQAVADVQTAMKDIRLASANARDATAEARSLLIRNRSKFDSIIDAFHETSTTLEAASDEVRRSPWRLLYRPSKDEMGNLNLYDSARLFARAAGQLNDAAGAVRDATKDPSVNREQLNAVMNDLAATFAKYQQVEKTFWDSVKQ